MGTERGGVVLSVSDTIGELLQERKDQAGAGMSTDAVQEEIARLGKLQRPTDGQVKAKEGKEGKMRGDETRHWREENKYKSAPKEEDKNYMKPSRRVGGLVREREDLVDTGNPRIR